MAAADKPLTGVRVLVTRPRHQAEHLATLIEQLGGAAIRFPAVEIAGPRDSTVLSKLIDRLGEFDMAIFVSPNAVTRALELVRARRLSACDAQAGGSLPARLAVAAVGQGSARELKRLGVENTIAPTERFDSESLLALPALKAVAGKSIVIFRGEGGRELLGATLAERGARVEYAECYRRARPEADTTALVRQWAQNGVDIVTITSVAGLKNLHAMLGESGRQLLLATPIVVVGRRVAEACRELGFAQPALVAAEASDAAIVAAIEAWRAAQNSL